MNQQTAKVGKSDYFKIPFSMLRVRDGFNVRTDYGDMESFTENIRQNGVKIPLRGYKEKGQDIYWITEGHRRYTACKTLMEQGIEITLPFIPEPQGYTDEQRLVDMFITAEGKNLTVLEQAHGVLRFINYGWEPKAISERLGKSTLYINKLLGLAHAPMKLQNLVRDNRISGSFAMEAIADGLVEELIAKAEQEPQIENEQGGFFEHERPERVAPSPARITKKDLATANSMKEFKALSKTIDEADLSESKLETFRFMWNVINNQMTQQELFEYFNR